MVVICCPLISSRVGLCRDRRIAFTGLADMPFPSRQLSHGIKRLQREIGEIDRAFYFLDDPARRYGLM